MKTNEGDTNEKVKTFFAGFLALLLAAAVALGLSACGGSEMTDDDVAALSAAVASTRGYDGSYTFTADNSITMELLGQKATSKEKYKYSYDAESGIEYTSDEESYSESDVSSLSLTETYILAESLDNGRYTRYKITDKEKSVDTTSSYGTSLSSQFSYYSMISLSSFSGLSTVEELEKVVTGFASSSDADVKLSVSGGKYTMSASYDVGKVSVSITVKDGLVTKMSASAKESEDGMSADMSSDIEISYSYNSSLASNFSDLSSFE